MNNVDKQYLELLRYILSKGVRKTDRTGTGTISVFDYTMKFDMSEGFPLLTSKKMFTKGVIHELIWFLKGDTSIKYLIDNDVHIWDGDVYKKYEKEIIRQRETQKKQVEKMRSEGKMVKVALIELLSKEDFINKIKTDDFFSEQWGDLGPVYGKQWRKWESNRELITRPDEFIVFDQISNLINDLRNNPDSRRLMVSAWNVGEIDKMTLPPCHYGFQCYTIEMNPFERKKYWCDSLGKSIHYAEDLSEAELDTLGIPTRKLSLKWNQRSVDTFLGLPFNIASYGFLLHILAKEVNMVPHELIFSGGDVHLYVNHIEQVKEQLSRQTYKLPKLLLSNTSIDNLKYDDFQIIDYKSDKVLKGELSN